MAKYEKGVAGIWLDEHEFVEAAKKARAMGYKKLEALSPYPIHGMEEALDIKRSSIPYVTFVMGLLGVLIGVSLTWWTSAVNWPINVGGKPFFSLPAFIPIIFELTILFAALSSVAALFIKAGLPKVDPPIIDPDLSCHKFALFIPESEAGYSVEKIEKFFRESGAHQVKTNAEY